MHPQHKQLYIVHVPPPLPRRTRGPRVRRGSSLLAIRVFRVGDAFPRGHRPDAIEVVEAQLYSLNMHLSLSPSH